VAAAAGWVLETLIERPLGRETLAGMPGYEGQEGFPRLAGFRWRKPLEDGRKPLEEIGTPDP
jgi:hypothetical protein